jgi:hypothetical protein
MHSDNKCGIYWRTDLQAMHYPGSQVYHHGIDRLFTILGVHIRILVIADRARVVDMIALDILKSPNIMHCRTL